MAVSTVVRRASKDCVAAFLTFFPPTSPVAVVGGVPAIDFGRLNGKLENQPASFRDFFKHLDGNPGACTVSTKCYLPNQLVETW